MYQTFCKKVEVFLWPEATTKINYCKNLCMLQNIEKMEDWLHKGSLCLWLSHVLRHLGGNCWGSA